jgi:hypothetical protein
VINKRRLSATFRSYSILLYPVELTRGLIRLDLCAYVRAISLICAIIDRFVTLKKHCLYHSGRFMAVTRTFIDYLMGAAQF